jgi:pimeloyl-ACP methyl ester carboxylesterase
MFEKLKRLKYKARVFLSRSQGRPETLDVNGRSVVMLHGGDEKATPFVYLHSTMGESYMWFPFYQSWAKQFRVLVPTHPGFGKSTGFDQIDTIEDMAYAYVELFDALGLDEVVLGGISLGGWIAAEFAVRWPERVKKLWIAAAPGMWVDEEPLPDLFRYMQDRRKLRELLFGDPESPLADLVLQDNPDEERLLTAYQNMTALARLVWDRPYDPKLPRRLARVQCPTLLLWGAQDRLVPPSYAKAYHKYLPHAELKLIPDCGHLLMFERENEFVEAVARFAAAGDAPKGG